MVQTRTSEPLQYYRPQPRNYTKKLVQQMPSQYPVELAVMANRNGTPPVDDGDLPATFRSTLDKHTLIWPSADYQQFLHDDLSVERVEDVQSHLWLVGRPFPARALNIQKVLGREIIPTTDASLHLVWTSKKIHIKALPRYMTSSSFYDADLAPPRPYGPALGLLFTYMTLVPTELDFAIASQLHLFHENYDWDSWRKLARRILEHYPKNAIYEHLPKRYVYGELRLSRLDKIYRYCCGSLLHGFSPLLGNTRYVEFFADHLRFITATTIYTALVLTAMQVGLATEPLSSNESFRRASYGFTVFAIISPIIAVGFVVLVATFVVLASWVSTIAAQRRRHDELHPERALQSRRSKHVVGSSIP
jgi:hypothetical protein